MAWVGVPGLYLRPESLDTLLLYLAAFAAVGLMGGAFLHLLVVAALP